VEAEAQLELLAPVSPNIVCFRDNPSVLDDAALNLLNREVMVRLQEEGTAALSDTLLWSTLLLLGVEQVRINLDHPSPQPHRKMGTGRAGAVPHRKPRSGCR